MGGPPKPGTGLAARFRQALADRAAARNKADADQERVRQAAQAARRALFADLEAFAREVGAFVVRADAESVTFALDGRQLVFRADGDADRVVVEGATAPEVTVSLVRQPELGNRWVVVRRKRRAEERLPLFDAGLEALLVDGLGLPPPATEPVAPAERDRKL